MKCDACKSEELLVIKVPRYPKPMVITGYVLWVLAVLAAAGTVVYMQRSGVFGAGENPTDRARQDAVMKLQQINAVTPEMIKDFQDDGQISETSLSKLGPDDRADVDAILTEYRTGGFNSQAGGSGWLGWGMIFAVWLAVFGVGLAMTLRKEKLKCAKCGVVIEVEGV